MTTTYHPAPMELTAAYADDAMVRAVEAHMRLTLQAALNYAKAQTAGMSAEYRERFIDALTEHFAPDGLQRDLFADCFHPFHVELAARIADLEGAV